MSFIHTLWNRLNEFWDKNYLYAAGIKIITAVQFMVLAKLVALKLSLADVGIFFLMYNSAFLISALLFSTYSASLLRYYSIIRDKPLLYKSVLGQLWVVAFILILASIYSCYFYKDTIGYPVTLGYAASLGFLSILTTKFRVATQFKQLFYFLALNSLILASVVVMSVLYVNLSPELIIGCLAISTFVSLGYYVLCNGNSVRRVLQKSYDKKIAQSLFIYGIPFVFLAVSNIVISTNGQFMLKYFGHGDEVGIYATNYNIGEKGVFLWFSLLVMVNVPKIYHAHENYGRFAAWDTIRNCMVILGICGGIVLVFAFFWSRELSAFFSSDEISNLGHWIIPSTVISAVLLGFCSLLSELLFIERKSRTVAFCYVASSIISIVLSYLFISAYGLVGAVLGPIVSNMLLLSMILICLKKNK
ncbi:MATE family efflux transporter [bacterium]|nr:MATE family efflux transporter [bacterium]